MLSIEPAGISEQPCTDCRNTTKTVWGFVSKNGAAYAVYYARWTSGHLDRGAQLYVSIGGWGEPNPITSKVSVGLDSRMGEDRPGFMVVDATILPWSQHAELGRPLTRQDALSSGAADAAFAIIDEVVEKDTRLRSFYQTGA